jgi:putative copper resistance protein D
VRELTYLVLLGTGLLFVLPLLTDELVPAWCTPPLRALIGFADGLLDAVPGVVVMASPALLGAPVAAYLAAADPMYQQRLGGMLMFAIAECVGIPLLAATVVAWVRYDAKEAAAVDARLDAERLQRRAAALADGGALGGAVADGRAAQGLEAELDRPWWESDPRFTRRPR